MKSNRPYCSVCGGDVSYFGGGLDAGFFLHRRGLPACTAGTPRVTWAARRTPDAPDRTHETIRQGEMS